MGKFSSTFTDKLRGLLFPKPLENGPLSSPRLATEWLEQLPVGDALKAHAAILKEIRQFNEELTLLSKSRLEVLMLLDEKAQDLADTLARQYVRNARMTRSMESQLWNEIYNLLWETARSYHAFILNLHQPAANGWLAPHLPKLSLRLIKTFGSLMKWRTIRYQQPGDKLWLRLHNLYKVAEVQGFHQTPLHAYPADSQATTCETEYLHCLMLQQAHAGTLYPRQLDLVDRWLGKWAPTFLSITSHLDVNHHTFNVDLTADRGPTRIRNADNESSFRFWATKELVAHLAELRESLKNGSPPSAIGLTEDVRTAEALDLLDHLGRQWSPLMGREQRRHPRKAIKKLVSLVHGLPDIITCLRPRTSERDGAYMPQLVYDEMVDVQVYGFVTDRTRERTPPQSSNLPGTAGSVESWVIHDESECGFGAIVETSERDWLRVGTLTAVRANQDGNWALGVLRRLSRTNERESLVGIETLPGKPEIVLLYGKRRKSEGYSVDGVDAVGAELPVAAIRLSAREPGKTCLIMDPADYQHHAILEIRRPDERQTILLNHPVERGDGWVRVMVDLLETDSRT
jgi:hypothetical protein